MEGLSQHEKETRPWGNFERFTLNESTTVKLLRVEPGAALSLQYHNNREEFWRILQGGGMATIGERELPAELGNSFFIPRNAIHRFTGGPEGALILEIAFGTFDENDLKRLEDNYGRA